MRVIRGLLVGLALLLLIAAVAVAVLVSPFGQRAAHDALASWASAQLGRTVRIDGDFSLKLGRHIQLGASGVHLANTDWGSRPDMLVAQHVMIEFDSASLLSRAPTLIVDEIRIDGLDLLLERTAEGANNWRFDRPPSEPGPPWLGHLPFVVDRVSMPGARIQFIGPRLDRPLDVRFAQIDQQRGAGDMLNLSAVGTANDIDLELTGQIGPFENLIDAKEFSATLDGHVGEVTLAVRTRIDSLERPVDSTIDVEVNGPSAAYVTTTLGVRNLGDGPFNLSFKAARAPDGNGVQASLLGNIGEFDISSDGELSEPSVMRKLTFRTEISGPDVSLLAGIVGLDLLPAERFRLVATIRRTGPLLQIDHATLDLPDSAFSVQGSVKRIDRLAGDDLTIHIEGQTVEKFRKLLRIPGIATGPFDLTATLRPADSGEDTLQLTAKTTLLDLSATGPLGAYPEFHGTRLRFTVSGPDFTPWAQTIGLSTAPRAAFAGQGQFEWTDKGIALRSAVLNVGDDAINVDGLIGALPELNADLRFGLQGKRLETVGNYVGWSGFPAQPYKIAGRVVRQQNRTRLDSVDIASAGARLQLNGTVGNAPRWQDTTLTFAFDGQDLRPFAALARGVGLPAGPFRAQGTLTYGDNRIGLRNVSAAVAGSQGSVTADIALPLGAPVSTTRFDIQASGPDLTLLIPDVADSSAARQKFDLRAKGSLGVDKWVFETLRFDSPGGSLNVQGQLDRAPDYSATTMNIQARTTDLRRTGHLFDIELPAESLDFSAALSGTPYAFRMDNLSGHFGQSDFTGSVALDLRTKPDLDVRVSADFLDLTPLTDSIPDATVAPIVADARSIPNVEVPTALLHRVNGRFGVQSAKTSFFGQTYDGLQLQATLLDGRLTVDPLTFGSADGNLTARLSIDSTAAPTAIRLVASGDQIRLGVWPGMNETAAASRYTIAIDLAAAGPNLRDLIATLDGQIRLVGAGGHVPNSRANAVTSDFLTELARTLNPIAKRKPFTDVVCQAYLFSAAGGMLRTDPAIVIRTADVDIISNGSVNLQNEAIDFNFKTAARGGLGFSAGELLNSYVKVSGTLAKPHLTVDPKGTLVNGGAAFATGGLSILATTLWDRMTRQKDPCAAAVAEAGRRATNRPF